MKNKSTEDEIKTEEKGNGKCGPVGAGPQVPEKALRPGLYPVQRAHFSAGSYRPAPDE